MRQIFGSSGCQCFWNTVHLCSAKHAIILLSRNMVALGYALTPQRGLATKIHLGRDIRAIMWQFEVSFYQPISFGEPSICDDIWLHERQINVLLPLHQPFRIWTGQFYVNTLSYSNSECDIASRQISFTPRLQYLNSLFCFSFSLDVLAVIGGRLSVIYKVKVCLKFSL